jgi:hypothetical protein
MKCLGMRLNRFILVDLLALLCALAAGCAGSSTPADSGAPTDSGSDAADASSGLDAGDVGSGQDAGDAGCNPNAPASCGDAGSGSDGGNPDAGSAGDGGTGVDSGTLWVIGTNDSPAGPLLAFPAAASGAPVPLLISGSFFHAPRGPAVDSAGNVYVASFVGSIDQVDVFSPGATTPTRTITSLDLPSNEGIYAIAVDGAGNLYTVGDTLVSSNPTYGVSVFPPDSGADAGVLRTFTSALFTTNGVVPKAMGVDTSGNVYLSFQNAELPDAAGYSNVVAEYSSSASGSVEPIRTIVGPSTQLGTSAAFGLTVDASGEIYLAVAHDSYLPSRVLVFASGSKSGDQAPERELVGSDTQLDDPCGLALNPFDGNLYVANYASNPNWNVNVYPASAGGDESPLRTILLSSTGDAGTPVQPFGIAIGP